MALGQWLCGGSAIVLGFLGVLIAHWSGDDRSYIEGRGPLGFAIGIALMAVALIAAGAVFA